VPLTLGTTPPSGLSDTAAASEKYSVFYPCLLLDLISHLLVGTWLNNLPSLNSSLVLSPLGIEPIKMRSGAGEKKPNGKGFVNAVPMQCAMLGPCWDSISQIPYWVFPISK